MKSFAKTSLLIFVLIIISTTSNAQYRSYYDVGISAGTLVYQGDLTRSSFGTYRSLKPAVSLSVSKQLDPYFAIRAGLTLGKIGVDESQFSNPVWKQQRNFQFSTPITELSAVLVFNILGENTEKNYHTFSPYIFGGIGATFLNVQRDWSRMNTDFKSYTLAGIAIDSAHSLPKTIPVIPLGLGIAYDITSRLAIKAEATYRLTFTDYLDGFSYAANPTAKDSYYGLSLGVSFKIGNNSFRCPVMRR